MPGSLVLTDGFKRTGEEADGEGRGRPGPRAQNPGRKDQDKRRERDLGASVVGGSSMEPSRDKGQARVQWARTETARASS